MEKNIFLTHVSPYCYKSQYNIKIKLDELEDVISSYHNKNLDLELRRTAKRILGERIYQSLVCSSSNPNLFKYLYMNPFVKRQEEFFSPLLSYNSLGPEVHNIVSCILDVILHDDYSIIERTVGKDNIEKNFKPLKSEKLHDWFMDPKFLRSGRDKRSFFTLKNIFDNRVFLVKTAPTLESLEDLLHEAIVGMYSLNVLRSKVPNFMYVYGHFFCSPFVYSKGIISWCTNESSPFTSYLFTERITDSYSLSKFVKYCSVKDFIPVFLQILNALNLANGMYGFNHCDLHSNNVLVKVPSGIPDKLKIVIPLYQVSNGTPVVITYIITNNYIPFIIDYEDSRITLRYETNQGKEEFMEFYSLRTPDELKSEPFPMFDVYKLVCFLGEDTMNYKNKEVFNFLSEFYLMVFGDKDTLKARVMKREKDLDDYYNAPTKLKGITYEQCIEKFMQLCEKHVGNINMIVTNDIENKNYLVFPIQDTMSINKFCDLFREDTKINSLDYCDAVEYITKQENLSNSAKYEIISYLNKRFNSYEYFQEIKETLEIQVERFQDSVNKFKQNIRNLFFILRKGKIILADNSTKFVSLDKKSLEEYASMMLDPKFTKNYKKLLHELNRTNLIKFLLTSVIRSLYCSFEKQRFIINVDRRGFDILLGNYNKVITNYKSLEKFITVFVNNLRFITNNKTKIITFLLYQADFSEKIFIIIPELQEFGMIYNFVKSNLDDSKLDVRKITKFINTLRSMNEKINALIKYYKDIYTKEVENIIKPDEEGLLLLENISAVKEIIENYNRKIEDLTKEYKILEAKIPQEGYKFLQQDDLKSYRSLRTSLRSLGDLIDLIRDVKEKLEDYLSVLKMQRIVEEGVEKYTTSDLLPEELETKNFIIKKFQKLTKEQQKDFTNSLVTFKETNKFYVFLLQKKVKFLEQGEKEKQGLINDVLSIRNIIKSLIEIRNFTRSCDFWLQKNKDLLKIYN